MEPRFDHIVHGGDYNPDQWIDTPGIWDEDTRLMKLARINSATVGIFSWSLLEPEEGRYDFAWLDEIMDKLSADGIDAVLATPSGARPPWLAEKYPEVLRVAPDGLRYEYGVRHNHCLTSPVYRQKTLEINTLLAERYKDHPALKMWHVSNEYSGECYCELCRQAFRDWLRERYHGDIEELNRYWWNGFWAHRFNDFSQISPPTDRGENHVTALKLDWRRFVTDRHISFFENEIKPLREITPDVPITTNFMHFYTGIDYQRFASHVDVVSWDSYPSWERGRNEDEFVLHAFAHDAFRSMKGGQPFFMMESTPSIVNHKPVNKLPKPGRQTQYAVASVALGADSVQYFQWRKSRGGHEKFHGAVVDHVGTEDTRVFREVSATGRTLEKLGEVVGKRSESRVAVIFDWENSLAVDFYCGYNNLRRDYLGECAKWYAAFIKRGFTVDVISEDDGFGKYDLVIAPYLYMLKDGVDKKIAAYVRGGGSFAATYLFANVDSHDLCFLGGFPANELKEVFGIWAEETDSLPEDMPGEAVFNGKTYPVDHVLDVLRLRGAEVLGEYRSDFYAGSPAVTVNRYGGGRAYCAAFRCDGDFVDDFCAHLIKELALDPGTGVGEADGVFTRERGGVVFTVNMADGEREVALDGDFYDVINEKEISGSLVLPVCGYSALRKKSSR